MNLVPLCSIYRGLVINGKNEDNYDFMCFSVIALLTAVLRRWISSLTAVFVFIKSIRSLGAVGGNRYQNQTRRLPLLPGVVVAPDDII